LAVTVGLAVSLVGATSASADGTNDDLPCDHEFVSERNGVFTVTPNGVDDTDNVECAIQEASVYWGKTVRLTEGTFHLDFMFVDGFDGRIRGAGRDATTIEPLEGGLDCKTTFEELGFVFWIIFINSSPTFTDLRLSIPDVACDAPWIEEIEVDPDTGEESGFIAEDFNAMVLIATRDPAPTDQCGVDVHAGVTAKRLDVDAPQPNFGEPVFNPKGTFNTFLVLGTTPVSCDVPDRVVGDVIVSDSHAEGVGNLIEARSVTHSKIKVTDNHTVGVDSSVILVANEGSKARVVGNTIEDGQGLGVLSDACNGPDPALCLAERSRVDIRNNDIQMAGTAGPAILTFDSEFAPPQIRLTIRGNRLTGDGNPAGVVLVGADRARVAHNTFDGASVFGVVAAGPTTKSRIIDNDMTALTAFEAGILLEAPTSLNVVKRNAGATVVDLGTDNVVVPEVATIAPTARAATAQAATVSTSSSDWETSSGTYWSR
jgi:hypothetical protein